MFADLELPVRYGSGIVVPADAVVDSGVKKVVYVAKGDGIFEPRKVEIGWRAGDQVEIVKGLMAGETIVVSGTFLVDSESRMKAAAAGIYGESAADPVCKVEVDQARARAGGRTVVHQGQTFYFDSYDCKAQFERDPARFIPEPMQSGQGGGGSNRQPSVQPAGSRPGSAHQPAPVTRDAANPAAPAHADHGATTAHATMPATR
jgi:YHS domain-containing protein